MAAGWSSATEQQFLSENLGTFQFDNVTTVTFYKQGTTGNIYGKFVKTNGNGTQTTTWWLLTYS